MPVRIALCALLLGCVCPKPPPCSTCALSPVCVLDAPGQPPAPAGTLCGQGACDGKGACCQ